METNGNGWVKPVGIGVAIFVLGTAIVVSTGNTFNNSVARAALEVTVDTIKEDVAVNTEVVQGIDVMQRQMDTIEENVGKIWEKLDK